MQLIENKGLDPFLIAEISAIRKFSAHFRPVPSISNLRPQAAGRQKSNRHTYGKLEPRVSHRKQTPEPISNRHKNALHPRYPRLASLHPVATTVKMAARKLEFPLSGHSSTTSEFLIDNFQRDLTLVECLSPFSIVRLFGSAAPRRRFASTRNSCPGVGSLCTRDSQAWLTEVHLNES